MYYLKGDQWADLHPEVVNFKTGGVLKSIGTAGIVKGDVNGHVNGEHSTTQLKTPVTLLVYVHEGVDITEYQLLRLWESKDAREFRTVTGGVMHVSGGATRDLMTFEGKKVAPRTYQVLLPLFPRAISACCRRPAPTPPLVPDESARSTPSASSNRRFRLPNIFMRAVKVS